MGKIRKVFIYYVLGGVVCTMCLRRRRAPQSPFPRGEGRYTLCCLATLSAKIPLIMANGKRKDVDNSPVPRKMPPITSETKLEEAYQREGEA